MDGGLPSVPGAAAPLPSLGPTAAPLQPPPGTEEVAPVGRPSKDPARNEERMTKRQEVNRLMGLLPKSATDSKIVVYKIKNRRRSPNRCLTILASEIEENSADEPDDFIRNRILDEAGAGRYECVTLDRNNKRIADFAPWQLEVGDEEDFEEDDGEFVENGHNPHHPPPRWLVDQVAAQDAGGIPGDPEYGFQNNRPPPVPRVFDPFNLGKQMNQEIEERAEERKAESSNMLMMMMQQMTAANQQQMQMFQQQAADREARERERYERERQEESARRERDAQRASERTQLLATLAPLLAPMLQKMMDGKEDTITPLLITKLIEGDQNKNGMHELFALMSAASKQQVEMQGEMARQNMQAQSQTQSVMTNQLVEMMKDTLKTQRAMSEIVDTEEETTPVDKLLSLFEKAGPLIGALAKTTPAGPAAVPAIPQVPTPVPPPPPQPAQPQQVPKEQAPEGQEAAEPELSDEQRIHGALNTVMGMHTGRIPEDRHEDAMNWLIENIPDTLAAAIMNNDQAQITALSAGVVQGNPDLMQWIMQPEAQQYLNDILLQLQQILNEAYADEASIPEEEKAAMAAATTKEPPPDPEPTEDGLEDDSAAVETEVDEYPVVEEEPAEATEGKSAEGESTEKETAEEQPSED